MITETFNINSLSEKIKEYTKKVALLEEDYNNEYNSQLQWAKLNGIEDPHGNARDYVRNVYDELYATKAYLQCLNDIRTV